MQRTARELNLSETVFLLAGERRRRRPRADLHPGDRAAVRRPPGAGQPRSCSAARRGLDQVRLRDRRRAWSRSSCGARAASAVVRRDGAADPDLAAASSRAESCWRRSACERSQLPVEVYDNGPRHAFVALESDGEVAALRQTWTRSREVGTSSASAAFTRARTGASRRGCSDRRSASPRTRRPGRRPVRWRCTWRATGVTRSGSGWRSRQGTEIGRPSVLHACAEGSADRIERVLVGGGAVIVAHGEYRLD